MSNEQTAYAFVTEFWPNGTPDMDGPHEYDNVDWEEVVEHFNEEVEEEEIEE